MSNYWSSGQEVVIEDEEVQVIEADNDGVEIEAGEFDFDISALNCDEFSGGFPSVFKIMSNHCWMGRSSILGRR